MKYYKDENNQVYAYEEDGSQDSFIKDGLQKITKNQADKLIDKLKNELQNQVDSQVPTSISMAQAEVILKITKLDDGRTLYNATNDYINSLNDDSIENIKAKSFWSNAKDFNRDSSLIKMAQSMFNLTDEQVDEMFRQGAKITA